MRMNYVGNVGFLRSDRFCLRVLFENWFEFVCE